MQKRKEDLQPMQKQSGGQVRGTQFLPGEGEQSDKLFPESVK